MPTSSTHGENRTWTATLSVTDKHLEDQSRGVAALARTTLQVRIVSFVKHLNAARTPIHQDVIHLVGGGSRNELLCQLTADATGKPVIAGPAEAAALGNVLVQARARGLVGDRHAMRSLVAETQPLRRHEPTGGQAAWDAAAARLGAARRTAPPR